MKIQKKNFFFFLGGGGGLGWGVRVDVIQELKFFGKFKKKLGGGRVGPWGGPGWGVRMDSNEELKFL